MTDVLAIALVGAVILGSIAYALFRMRLKERRRRAFEQALGQLAAWFPMRRLSPFLAQGTGERGGRAFVAEMSSASSDSAFGYLRVRLGFDPYERPDREAQKDDRGSPLEGPAGMRFRPRTLLHRLGAALGLERTVAVRDAMFERAVQVDSDASDAVLAAFLRGEPARGALLRLLASGARHVDVLIGDAIVTAAWRNPTKDRTDGVLDAVDLLGAVAGSVPVVAGDPVQRGRRLGLTLLPITWSALAFAGLLWGVFIETRHPIVDGEAWGDLGAIGVLIAVVGGVLSYGICRHRNRGAAHFAISLPAALLAGVTVTVVLGWGLNRALDRGPATPHESRVIEVGGDDDDDVSRGRQHVYLTSWRPGGLPVRVDVPAIDPHRFYPGAPVIVHSRPGYFGWEWVESLESPPRIDSPPIAPAPPVSSPTGR